MSTSKSREFAKAFASHWDELQLLVKNAEEALEAAKQLSEDSGLPFMTPLGVHVPDSFERFRFIDLDFVETLTDIAAWQMEDKVQWRSSSANC